MNQLLERIPNPFGLALALSALTHAVLIGTLGFTPKLDRLKDHAPPLEVVLVNAKTETAPHKAELLAQTNLDRGGNTDTNRRMKSPLPAPPDQPVKQAIRLPADYRRASAKAEALPTSEPSRRNRAVETPREVQQVMTQDSSRQHIESAPEQHASPEPAPVQEDTSPPSLNASQLRATAMEAARLEAIISKSMDEYNKRPKRKFLGSRAMEYRFAAYVEAWRQKVEKIGNLNYPTAAREQKLYGSLRMTVSIKSDGTVEKIELNKSSGFKILDDAAYRIVELGAPYAEFPPDIRRDTDIIDITRTWTFTREDTLAGGE